ncbi:MBL fold metallo-hydrolase [Paenibacillus kandeliae]|uniref:MBL fold metallo-hydrolase n=1 Tax=Paenibacillus kandeliae TaxID=3231269 RepID=UPI0034594C13
MAENPLKHVKIPMTTVGSGDEVELREDVYGLTLQFVNVAFVGKQDNLRDWVLVDTGLPQSASKIIKVANERFGTGARPKAIILTHGHFDHAGSVVELAEKWDVPVYAHALEMPFLTGESRYPSYDPGVEGGLNSKLSAVFPNKPIDLRPYIHNLPVDNSVPGLPEWRWIHTPGHAPGHISLFRERDKMLLAGDAFITVDQDKLWDSLIQKRELCGPPRYATTDWDAARESVQRLASLEPESALTGHGQPIIGPELSASLIGLAEHFDEWARPSHGKYVDHPTDTPPGLDEK